MVPYSWKNKLLSYTSEDYNTNNYKECEIEEGVIDEFRKNFNIKKNKIPLFYKKKNNGYNNSHHNNNNNNNNNNNFSILLFFYFCKTHCFYLRKKNKSK